MYHADESKKQDLGNGTDLAMKNNMFGLIIICNPQNILQLFFIIYINGNY